MHVNSLMANMFQTADGLFVVDQDQRILFWNQGAQDILGYVSEDVIGKRCSELVQGVTQSGQVGCAPDCPIADCGLTKRRGPGQNFLIRAKNGSFRWLSMVHIFMGPFNGTGTAPAMVHVFRDITPEMEAKKTLERIAEQLSGFGLFQSREEGCQSASVELTEREKQVLALLAQGEATNAIAQKLTISNTTARNHIQNILSKLGVHTRLEAVAFALRHKVVESGWLYDSQTQE
jgi:PAS domain S-box-containing protein